MYILICTLCIIYYTYNMLFLANIIDSQTHLEINHRKKILSFYWLIQN